jgi:hypothetical protein
MTNYQVGDLVLVDFPFTVSGPGKPRPALVILDTGDADVLVAPGDDAAPDHSLGCHDLRLAAGWTACAINCPPPQTSDAGQESRAKATGHSGRERPTTGRLGVATDRGILVIGIAIVSLVRR